MSPPLPHPFPPAQMKFFLPFALLSPLATVSAQGAMDCTASIETRTIDMMKTETQWVNNGKTS